MKILAKKSETRIILETRYRKSREKLLKQISTIKKSPYKKDVESAIAYIEPRIPAVSKIKTKRDLEFAMREVDSALNQKRFVGAERRRIRTRRAEYLKNKLELPIKNYRDVKKFDKFMEDVRNFSLETIYDSERAITIFEKYPKLTNKELVKKYDEYRRVNDKRPKRSF